MVVGIALTLPNAVILAPMISMGTPLVAVGLITLFRTRRGARRRLWGTFGLRHAGWRSWPVAFVVSLLAVFVVPFGVAYLLGSAHFIPLSSIDVPGAALRLLLMLAMLTVMALAEEIGWRSYLLPRMQVLLPRRRAAIVVGFCHGLFHLPLILFTSTYDSVGSRWIVAPLVLLLPHLRRGVLRLAQGPLRQRLAGRLRPRHRQPLHRWFRPHRDPVARSPGIHRYRKRSGHLRRDHRDRSAPPGAWPHLGSSAVGHTLTWSQEE